MAQNARMTVQGFPCEWWVLSFPFSLPRVKAMSGCLRRRVYQPSGTICGLKHFSVTKGGRSWLHVNLESVLDDKQCFMAAYYTVVILVMEAHTFRSVCEFWLPYSRQLGPDFQRCWASMALADFSWNYGCSAPLEIMGEVSQVPKNGGFWSRRSFLEMTCKFFFHWELSFLLSFWLSVTFLCGPFLALFDSDS